MQQPENLILACGALAHDFARLLEQTPSLAHKMKLQCLPAKLHNTPDRIADEVDSFLAKNATKYKQIFVAYGDCGTGGALDVVLDKYNASRLSGSHCYEFFAGSKLFENLQQEIGSFFVTDYLIRNFEKLVMQSLGLDKNPELFDLYFANYKKFVYLAQTNNLVLKQKAQKYADSFGFEFDYRPVGTTGLLPAISNFDISDNHVFA